MNIIHFLERLNTVRNFFIFLLFLIIVFYFWAKARAKEFSENEGFSIAIINSVSPGHQYQALGPTFYYSYKVDGKIYDGATSRYMAKKNNEFRLIGKSFPVVYNKLHPDRSSIIILSDEFSIFKLVQPDSLKWVNDIVW